MEIEKILKENYTKDDFVKFIINNEIFSEFIVWHEYIRRRKNERDKESNKLL